MVWELWPCLAAGAALHLATDASVHSVEDLLDWWRQKPLTVSFLPTPIAEIALQEEVPVTLRYLLVGGDALRLVEEDRPVRLINNYGVTEAAVVSTSGPVSGGEGQAAPIGRPISNTRIYLLDGSLEPVPVGVAGEIHIGGAGVARGYWNRAELTAEKFIASPFVPGGRTLIFKASG